MMLRSAKVFGQFLVKCTGLRTLRWFTEHIHRQYTCHGIATAFCGIYLPSLSASKCNGIEDVHLPPFPLSYRNEERVLYREMVSRLKLKRLHFRGDLSIMDWKAMGACSERLEYLHLNPSRTTNESFTECFTECGGNLKYLKVELAAVSSSGWYQNDELTNFILPYFRGKYLKHIQQIDITVKFLEEKSLFSFLLKCKYAHSLQRLTINAQSFNGTMRNEDIRKYIGQFVGNQQFEFTLIIQSQFYPSRRVLNVCRLSGNKGIDIDKESWKSKRLRDIELQLSSDHECLST